jgi:hypothetical protein
VSLLSGSVIFGGCIGCLCEVVSLFLLWRCVLRIREDHGKTIYFYIGGFESSLVLESEGWVVGGFVIHWAF